MSDSITAFTVRFTLPARSRPAICENCDRSPACAFSTALIVWPSSDGSTVPVASNVVCGPVPFTAKVTLPASVRSAVPVMRAGPLRPSAISPTSCTDTSKSPVLTPLLMLALALTVASGVSISRSLMRVPSVSRTACTDTVPVPASTGSSCGTSTARSCVVAFRRMSNRPSSGVMSAMIFACAPPPKLRPARVEKRPSASASSTTFARVRKPSFAPCTVASAPTSIPGPVRVKVVICVG